MIDKSRFVVRARPKGVTFTRGVCLAEGCTETRLGPSGLCLRTHQTVLQRELRVLGLGLSGRPLVAQAPVNHCVCVDPVSSRAGALLRMVGTVECSRCGRAMFDSDGAPVRV